MPANLASGIGGSVARGLDVQLIELTEVDCRVQLFHLLDQNRDRLQAARCFYVSTHPYFNERKLIAQAIEKLASFAPFSQRDVVVLDRSNELSLKLSPESTELLHRFCQAHDFAPRRVIFSSQGNTVSDYLPSGSNFSWLPYDAWPIRFALETAQSMPPGDFDFEHLYHCPTNFLCTNGTVRTHRHILMDHIKNSPLKDAVTLSNLRTRRDKNAASVGNDILKRFKDFAHLVSETGDVAYFPEATIPDDEFHNVGGTKGAWPGPRALTFPHRAARDTHVALVTESEFLAGIARVTEKVFKPIAYHRPFVLFGNYRSLALLREFGFETFPDQIDESYDMITSANERMKFLLSEVNRLYAILNDIDSRKRFLDGVRAICAHNQQYLLNGFVGVVDKAAIRSFNQIMERPPLS